MIKNCTLILSLCWIGLQGSTTSVVNRANSVSESKKFNPSYDKGFSKSLNNYEAAYAKNKISYRRANRFADYCTSINQNPPAPRKAHRPFVPGIHSLNLSTIDLSQLGMEKEQKFLYLNVDISKESYPFIIPDFMPIFVELRFDGYKVELDQNDKSQTYLKLVSEKDAKELYFYTGENQEGTKQKLAVEDIFEKYKERWTKNWDIAAVKDENDEWFVLKLCYESRKISIRRAKESTYVKEQLPGGKAIAALGSVVQSAKRLATNEWTYWDNTQKKYLSFANLNDEGINFETEFHNKIYDTENSSNYLIERGEKITNSLKLDLACFVHPKTRNDFGDLYLLDILKRMQIFNAPKGKQKLY